MTAPATPPDSDTPPDDRAWARPLYGRQIALLDDLAEEAREIARVLARRVMAADADDSLTAVEATALLDRLSRAHGRASRAVRLTLMLQARLMTALEAWDHQAARTADWAVTEQRLARDRLANQQRAQVERVVERVAGRRHDDAREVELLVEEASERLDREDVHGGILSKPVSEWIDLICRDLGLDPDWPRLAQEAWAREEMDSPAAGWPLTGLADRSGGADAGRLPVHKASP
jgi:hypothetical protein